MHQTASIPQALTVRPASSGLGAFAQLATPFPGANILHMAGAGGILYVGTTGGLWSYSEAVASWLPVTSSYARCILPLADGRVLYAQGNKPSRIQVFDPAHASFAAGNVQCDNVFFTAQQLPSGAIFLFGGGASYLVGSSNKGYNRVWAGTDPLNLALAAQISDPQSGLFIVSGQAADGTGKVWAGGDLSDVYLSADGGVTWKGLGIFGQVYGDVYGTLGLPDGTILVSRQKQGGGSNILWRLPPGGAWTASGSGLIGYDDLRGLAAVPGYPTLLAGCCSSGNAGGMFKSTDGGNTWTACTGFPNGSTGAVGWIACTAANAYAWCRGAGTLYVAANG